AQLLLRQVDLAEQRIGKDLVQLGEETVLIGGREIAQGGGIGFRPPEQDLRRHRALIALAQGDVARGEAATPRNLGLRQSQLLANPPKTRADKQLLSSLRWHGSLPDLFITRFTNKHL